MRSPGREATGAKRRYDVLMRTNTGRCLPAPFLAVMLATAAFPVAAESVPATPGGELVGAFGQAFGAPPDYPDGALNAATRADIEAIIASLAARQLDTEALGRLKDSGDARILWFVADLLRFVGQREIETLNVTFEELTGMSVPRGDYNAIPDHLMAWDLPAFPGYRRLKGDLMTQIESRWEPFFADTDSAIDWRPVAWGGVLMDDRGDASPGQRCFRCIPALDDPPVTDAAGGSWYPDAALVFGLVVNGAARAYPKNIMEVHEMVNDTLGGRRFGMPYCTLCGSAQAYYTDDIKGFSPVLRTSGLLARSNKFMYDLVTTSAVDTFTGRALSGPLHEAGVILNQLAVVTSTWGAWKEAHPDTTIVAEDGGIPGNRYPMDPLRGRDDNGPIFPVGDVDPRLAVQERVLGVIGADGTAVAFPVANAVLALQAGAAVELAGVRVAMDGTGIRAFNGAAEAPSHEAFWFAWSQFHPGTLLWQRDTAG